MVERCVRDAEVASSNLVASILYEITYWYMAYWSSGQDAALSRRKPEFDSRIGHNENLQVIPEGFCVKGSSFRMQILRLFCIFM